MIRTALALLAVVALATSAAAAETSPITIDSVLEGMNACRLEAGLPPLQANPLLEAAADDRVRDMEELGYWAHQSPDGRSPFTWVRARGYDFSYAGENLASGYETCEVLMSSWMESPGHRENIMSPLYSEVGIAIIDGSTVRRTVGKSVVVLFARHQSPQPAPQRRATTPGAVSSPPVRTTRAGIAPPHTFGGPVFVPGTEQP